MPENFLLNGSSATGRAPITKLLVANRGEIAARVMRTARGLGISTVAVYSDPDAAAPYLSLADEAVRLPGAAPADTYLRGDLILAAAAATGAQAIHPGYGFLSENARFARDCAAAGVTFVGPPPDAIAAMGSKPAAKALMASAGVPVLPGATVTAGPDLAGPDLAGPDLAGPDLAGPDLAGRDLAGRDLAGRDLAGRDLAGRDLAGRDLAGRDLASRDLAEAGLRVGFPLLVKAAFGGGGRGMRLVREPGELAGAVAAASREAASAFGDGTVFLERFVSDPRHIEVQILGDAHGSVVHLFERECSIQRRYQKIIEEAPSPAVDEALRAALGEAAVAAGKAIGYTGAGTVEFVLDPAGDFFFLEVNTRLQVEHPVTELVTGLDLVELQLRIAEGEPLPAEVTAARITGHAIEARLYAEDVPAGFLPATGLLHRFAIPAGPGVRVDAGYADGSVVSPYYDAMLAKVIGYGRTRAEAARRLGRALAGAQLHGVTTNRDLLTGILAEDEFLAGRTDTGYLTRHDPAVLSRPAAAATRHRHAAAAALAAQATHRAAASVLRSLPSGWRNVPSTPQTVTYTSGGDEYTVAYTLPGSGPSSPLTCVVNDEALPTPLTPYRITPDTVDLEAGSVRRVYSVHRVTTTATTGGAAVTVYVDGPDGSSALAERPRFTDPSAVTRGGSLLAPMPGVVLRVLAGPGTAVRAGQPLIVLEAMKMEHAVAAPADGTVAELRAAPGQQVDAGQVLAVVTADEADEADGGN